MKKKLQKNSGAEIFLEALIAAYSRFPVSPETKTIYLEKLSKWNLKAAQWDFALDHITEELKDATLPAIGLVIEFLKAAKTELKTDGGWLTFMIGRKSQGLRIRNVNGKWWAVVLGKVPNPKSVHGFNWLLTDQVQEIKLSDYARDLHYSPDYPADEGRCTPADARAAFLEGWSESGADPEKCPRIDRLETILPDLEEVGA